MANFHSDEWIMEQLNRHYQEALTLFPEDRIVGVFLQGSQNYGLDYEGSDIDTKCIVLPTLEDLIFNRFVLFRKSFCIGNKTLKIPERFDAEPWKARLGTLA